MAATHTLAAPDDETYTAVAPVGRDEVEMQRTATIPGRLPGPSPKPNSSDFLIVLLLLLLLLLLLQSDGL
ncbi:hypothetical protein N9995_00170 [bacterium]|nr:hypothetical protein [bacterium]